MDSVNVLVVFYSRNGSTEKMAQAVAEGAKEAGADIRLRRARDIVRPDTMAKAPGWLENSQRMDAIYPAPTSDDTEWADGVAFGTPTRFGNVSSELKAYIDSLGGIWYQGKMNHKAAGAFTSTGTPHGGNEATVFTLYAPLAHMGFVIVPLGYIDPVVYRAATPYGASTVSGQTSIPPSEDDLQGARAHGKRIANVARVLKALRS
jgi:NAD(P)H dehydrogenase (quinone)